jgi:hypothetical protein
MRLALFQPDIPQNTGAMLRLAACFGVGVDVIEPCGFIWDEPRMRRAGMDYLDAVELRRHASWEAYLASRPEGRLVLLTTRGHASYADFAFRAGRMTAYVLGGLCIAHGGGIKVPDDVLQQGQEFLLNQLSESADQSADQSMGDDNRVAWML